MKNIKLGLGTVQWGLPYGLTNENGTTAPETVTEILNGARCRGIKILDTASLYGDAETVLGSNSLESFHIVTKTQKFASSIIRDEHKKELVSFFYQSLQRLSCERIYGLLIHDAEDLVVNGGEKLVAAMMKLKDEGAVEKIGISIYDDSQVDNILKIFKPDIVQLPVSVLDQRTLSNGLLERLKNEGIEIHIRSVFLQGLLLMPMNKIPAYFDPVRTLLEQWHTAAQEQGMTRVQAALSFVRDIPYVDTVLVGIENLDHLQSCYEDFSIEASFDASNLACNDPMFVNPSLWKI